VHAAVKGSTASLQRRFKHKVPLRRRYLKRKIAGEHCSAAGVHAPGVEENVMAAEIHKLEAAARMAMGHFEGQAAAASTRRRERSPRLAYALLALAAFGLAVLALL
jgi:hypothetical protein